ncbi:molybdopterin molybdotransferase MoeA [Chitinophaga barathri]|uniref:Molybdopterin molybdenumtransferase n=1 Tax=Chitinophaga barathri TaxID=1647451 RepID=A0A3N4MHY6_9BACT|nr:molybdopterin molybdotransferase MoeA [Chitinophaga barathri]RPD41387.1 molybdopterin molybdenumtransferase MoeA [Chitinophaga barathri]
MMPVPDAFKAVMATVKDAGITTVLLEAAAGRILREQVIADRPFPPYDRVAMDGIAIAFDSYARGQRVFGLEDVQAAGMPRMQLANLADCMEVMTGAILPELTDAVIPYEHTEAEEHEGFKRFTVVKDVVAGQHIHRQGSDVPAGKILLGPGVRIAAPEVGVLASVGKAEVKVSAHPRICLVATGDELVEIRSAPEQHQVRMSNVYSIAAALHTLGIPAEIVHLRDEPHSMEQQLRPLLSKADVLICTGAVSAGKFDHLPQVLERCGMQRVFHKISQKPGKPFLFGTVPGGPVIFALPGNPVSVQLCYFRYIQPWLLASMHHMPEEQLFAALETEVKFDKPLTYFLPVQLQCAPGARLTARPVTYGGSGDMASLLHADAFMELPPEPDVFPEGAVFPVWKFR